jgi:hypothetical protein
MSGAGLVIQIVRSVRRRTRHAVVVVVLTVLSVALLAGAYYLQGYWEDLAMNLGASLVLVIATYLIFNPLFAELQAATIQEHQRLDYPRFITEVGGSQSVVEILETWTGLLEAPYLERFLDAVRGALRRRVSVRILLLHPDSNPAEQRTEELGGHDVRSAIMTNLRDLHRFWHVELTAELRERLDIRVYDAMPSVQLYRWDDKAFISFYPLGQLAYDTPQIEAFMATPWGEFVQARFDELWTGRETLPLRDYMTLEMRVHHDGTDLGACRGDFVVLAGTLYVHAADLVAHVIRYGRDGVTVRVPERTEVQPRRAAAVERMLDYHADSVDDEPLLGELRDAFHRKYGIEPDIVVRLVPDDSPAVSVLDQRG